MKTLYRFFGSDQYLDGDSLNNVFKFLIFDSENFQMSSRYHVISESIFYEHFSNIESLKDIGVSAYHIGSNLSSIRTVLDFCLSSKIKNFRKDTQPTIDFTPIKLFLIQDIIKDNGYVFLELLRHDIPFLKTLLTTYVNEHI